MCVLPPHTWQLTPLILRIFKHSHQNHNQDLLLLHLLDLTSLIFCINQGHMKGECWFLIANLMRLAWNIDWAGEKVKWPTMCLILRFILDHQTHVAVLPNSINPPSCHENLIICHGTISLDIDFSDCCRLSFSSCLALSFVFSFFVSWLAVSMLM